MRKILLSSMLACAAAFGLNAETVIGGISYTLNGDGTATVIAPESGSQYSGDLKIPETVENDGTTYTVTALGTRCCASSQGLITVSIPATVTEIGMAAFASTKNMTDIYMHPTVPPTINTVFINASFYNIGKTVVLHVPFGTKDEYISKMGTYFNDGFGNYNIVEMAQEIAVTGLNLNHTEYTGEAGEEFTITATVLPYNATDKTVVWTSSDESVATVADGVVTLVAEGTAEISASCGGFTAICKVTVESAYVVVESIALDQASFVGAPGSTFQLTATVLPEDATDKTVDWFSDDESVATVDENGLVTLVAVGEATITASPISNDALTATCKITVSNNVGIEGIEAEDGVAEYFNMQGMRVVNPEKGQMVIVRKGGKTFKVVR